MKQTFKNCNPTICNNDFLMTDGWEFMYRQDIKDRCVCINKQICIRIAELLQENKKKDALELIKQIEW